MSISLSPSPLGPLEDDHSTPTQIEIRAIESLNKEIERLEKQGPSKRSLDGIIGYFMDTFDKMYLRALRTWDNVLYGSPLEKIARQEAIIYKEIHAVHMTRAKLIGFASRRDISDRIKTIVKTFWIYKGAITETPKLSLPHKMRVLVDILCSPTGIKFEFDPDLTEDDVWEKFGECTAIDIESGRYFAKNAKGIPSDEVPTAFPLGAPQPRAPTDRVAKRQFIIAPNLRGIYKKPFPDPEEDPYHYEYPVFAQQIRKNQLKRSQITDGVTVHYPSSDYIPQEPPLAIGPIPPHLARSAAVLRAKSSNKRPRSKSNSKSKKRQRSSGGRGTRRI